MSLMLHLQMVLPSPVPETVWESWFQQWWAALTPEDFLLCTPPTAAEVTLRLTNTAEMQTLNQTWRGLDQPTDILSFAALEGGFPQEGDGLYLGDIAIGLPLAQAQAASEGHSLEIELAWLASHGLLHVLGWDHQDENSLEKMIDRQLALLEKVGLDYFSECP
jgi:probable rRNA maturation factor